MRAFPNESEQSKEVAKVLNERFALADEFYDYWTKLRLDLLSLNRLPDNVVNFGLILNIQICRQFRSIVEECSRCEASSGAILARSLFETALVLLFFLKHDIRLKPVLTKDTKKNEYRAVQGEEEGDRLTEEMRVNMYVMHMLLDDRRFFKRIATIEGVDPIEMPPMSPEELEAFEERKRILGEKWMSVLETSGHYSGLSVRHTAQLVDKGLFWWYLSIYDLQSRIAHGVDSLLHVEVDEGGHVVPRYLSAVDDVERVLMAGTQLFRICVSTMDDYVGFGDEVKERVAEFSKRCDALDNGDVPAD